MASFTVFCREAGGSGTTWIQSLEAGDSGEASGLGVIACAVDWGYDVDEVICVGVAAGDVEILYWNDELIT